MKIKAITVFLLLCLFHITPLAGQQHPPGIKWKKINTPNYEIIFPLELAADAQRIANTMEYLHPKIGITLKRNAQPWSIVLSNRGVESNGYVQLMPRMSEWFSTPFFSLRKMGVTEWYDVLAIHEGRHMVQFDKLNQGLGKTLSFLFGQFGMIFNVFSIPLWWWEGDAVGMETALTKGGRGREPSFDMGIRALLLSGIRHSYQKAYLSSYRHYYPNWYHLGYLLTTHVKRKYGPDAWNAVIDRFNRKPSFHQAVKRVTGRRVSEIYQDAMDELIYLWEKQSEDLNFSNFRQLSTAKRKAFTYYSFPRYTENGSIIAQKAGLADPTTIVRTGKVDEEKITEFNPINGIFNRLSYANGKIIWAELVPDPRWGKQTHTALVIYDLENGKQKRLIPRAKLFNPAFSPDGSMIAAIEFTPERKCSLVFINAADGRETSRIPNPENDLLYSPSWSDNGRSLIAIRQNSRGRTLSILDLAGQTWEDLLPWDWESVSHPVLFGKFVFHESPYSGIDNIYALDIQTKKRFQVTSSRFGAFFPDLSRDGKKLLYVDYTPNGTILAEIELKTENWRPLETIEKNNIRYYEPLLHQEEGPGTPSNQVNYPVENYRPGTRLVNLHSWYLLPAVSNLEFLVFSRDKFDLLSFAAGPKYNIEKKRLGFELATQYRRLFPYLDFSIAHQGRSASLLDRKRKKTTFSWMETNIKTGMQIPLNLSRGVNQVEIQIGSHLACTQVRGKDYAFPNEIGNGRFLSMSYSAGIRRIRSAFAYRDFRPRWGQEFQIEYSHTPFSGDYRGSVLSLKSSLFFPGLFAHHSLMVQAGYEWQSPHNYVFGSRIAFPRGYENIFYRKMYSFSLDYGLPLAYPDLALGNFFFLKRIRSNLFFDHGHGKNSFHENHYQSLGLDLIFDFHLFNFKTIEIEAGPRLIFNLGEKQFKFSWTLWGMQF